MPLFLIPILKEAFSFFTSKTGLIVLGIIALAIAIPVEILHFENVGMEKARAEQEANDKAWMLGANKNMDEAQAKHKQLADEFTMESNARAALELEIARLSAANDGRPGLDAAAVDRLRALSVQPGRGAGVQRPAAAAAGSLHR